MFRLHRQPAARSRRHIPGQSVALLLALMAGFGPLRAATPVDGSEAASRAVGSSTPWMPGKGFVVGSVVVGAGCKRLEMVPIPAGRFTMGSPATELERLVTEVPHLVTISKPFWMGKHEVTQGQWRAVKRNNPSSFTVAGLDAPVERVSWDDAVSFCVALTQSEAGHLPAGYVYRLPTEAEWEYAARAGTTSPFHSGSTLNSTQANFDGRSPYGSTETGPYLARTTRVGSYASNNWGLHDMEGNVWEWCADWYGPYAPESGTDPKGPASGSNRVMRGGGWNYDGRGCRLAHRNIRAPGYRSNELGFRVVLAPSL